MEDSELLEFFTNHWGEVVSKCEKELEPADREQGKETISWQDLQLNIWGATSHGYRVAHQIALIKPTLGHFSQFLGFFEKKMGKDLSAAFVWGVLGVLLQLVPEDPIALNKVPRMLKSIGYKLEAFNNLCANAEIVTNVLKEACFDMLVHLVEFVTASIKTLREDGGGLLLGGRHHDPPEHWLQFERMFTNINQELNETLVRIEKLTLVAAPQNTSGHLRSGSVIGLVDQPSRCFLLPPTKVPEFFNRVDIFEKIDQALVRSATGTSFRSVTLFGLGGIGKSAIATRYVEKKIEENEYDAIFWVHGEKELSLRQSFTDIALRLKLPGAEPQKHDENLILVQDWFQASECRWLVVYDNVESSDLLMPYWPGASHGKAIITSRNHSLALNPASSGIEVLSWDPQTGSDFLLFILKQAIGRDLESESTSAFELSKRLNGHALGLSHMAGLIHRRSWSITEFMTIYLKNPKRAHTSELEAIWEFSFKQLKAIHPDSAIFLSVVAFLMPDEIPQALFEFDDEDDILGGFDFCSDEFGLSEAIEPLLTLSLIKRNRDSRAFSIHRMVQTQYKFFMSLEDRQKAFNDAVLLLYRKFPKMEGGQLYEHWAECNQYQQHLISLAENFKDEHRISKKFKATWEFCDLLGQGQRFFYESNIMDDLESLCEISLGAVETIEDKDRYGDIKASILSQQANLYESIGKVDQSIVWNKEAYEIRLQEVPPRNDLIASFENNLGYCYNTFNDHKTALEYFEKSRTKSRTTFSDLVVKKNMGRCLIYLDRLDEARLLLLTSISEFREEEVLNWARIAYGYFALGLIDRCERKLESAEANFIEAQNLWLKGDHTRMHPFNGACMYKIGVVCLDIGKVEAAVKHLRDSLEITKHHSKPMPVEHARSCFKLSKALLRDPNSSNSDAEDLQHEAEVYLRRRNPDGTNFESEDEYDRFIPIFWR